MSISQTILKQLSSLAGHQKILQCKAGFLLNSGLSLETWVFFVQEETQPWKLHLLSHSEYMAISNTLTLSRDKWAVSGINHTYLVMKTIT